MNWNGLKMKNLNYFDQGVLAYEKKAYRKAFKLFLSGLANNEFECLSWLSNMYTTGLGVECNYEKAIEMDLKIFQLGNISGALNLGIDYRMIGDIKKSKYWFETAFNLGDMEAALELAKLYMVSDLEIEKITHFLKLVVRSNDVTEDSKEQAKNFLVMYENNAKLIPRTVE